MGLDAVSGKIRRVGTQRARLAKGTKRLGKLKILRRHTHKAAKLFNTNIIPVSCYGQATGAIAPNRIATLRARAAEIAAGFKAVSTTGALALALGEGLDPGVRLRVETIMQWIGVWSEHPGRHEAIELAWARQLHRLQNPAGRWKRVRSLLFGSDCHLDGY